MEPLNSPTRSSCERVYSRSSLEIFPGHKLIEKGQSTSARVGLVEGVDMGMAGLYFMDSDPDRERGRSGPQQRRSTTTASQPEG